jgi:hypothetical protein
VGCQDWKHCRTDTAYPRRRTRMRARRPTGGHRATRKPKTCPDSGRTSRAFSCEHKLGIVEQRQLYGLAQGGNVGFLEQQSGRPLPLSAVPSIRRQGQPPALPRFGGARFWDTGNNAFVGALWQKP